MDFPILLERSRSSENLRHSRSRDGSPRDLLKRTQCDRVQQFLSQHDLNNEPHDYLQVPQISVIDTDLRSQSLRNISKSIENFEHFMDYIKCEANAMGSLEDFSSGTNLGSCSSVHTDAIHDNISNTKRMKQYLEDKVQHKFKETLQALHNSFASLDRLPEWPSNCEPEGSSRSLPNSPPSSPVPQRRVKEEIRRMSMAVGPNGENAQSVESSIEEFRRRFALSSAPSMLSVATVSESGSEFGSRINIDAEEDDIVEPPPDVRRFTGRRRESRTVDDLDVFRKVHNVIGNHLGALREHKDVMGERWENKALEICEQELGQAKFLKRLAKQERVPSAGFGSKTRLSFESSKIKKAVTNDNEFLRHYNAVGGVGYAKVLDDPRIPPNEFFVPGKRFRLRLRHSNLRSDDDASSCQREVAIKFADQNEDGPLDLIFFTGRVAMAKNCKSFLDIIKLKRPQDQMEYCYKEPSFFFALVDGQRRAPESFAQLRYYSQVPYKFIPKKESPRLVKFRLIPAEECSESGLLDLKQQQRPWDTARKSSDTRSKCYLRTEFLKRIENAPIVYKLQIQIRNGFADENDDEDWNPQTLWDENICPWIDLADIRLTTPLTCSALRRTYFNITDKPTCLKFPSPVSVHDYRSYHRVCCTMYTTMEIKRCGDPKFSTDTEDGLRATPCGHEKTTHVIGVCAGAKKDMRSRVDVYVALTGTHGRSTPRRLDDKLEEKARTSEDFIEYYMVQTEPIGDILALTVGVRHRHLTEDWFLRYITVSDKRRSYEVRFPCHSVILSKITLRPGEVSLPQFDCHEVLRQERLLEIRDRQHEYAWQRCDGLPSRIKAQSTKDLPPNEQMRAEKFNLVLWDVDTQLAELIRPMLNLSENQVNNKAVMHVSKMDETSLTCRQSRVAALKRQQSAPSRPGARLKINSARAKWMKIKHAISFIAKVKLPDGPQGEMCRLCQDDKDFGRIYLIGSNPTVIRKCTKIPSNLAVTEEMVSPFLDRNKSLDEEMADGRIYMADYKIFEGIPSFHQDADHRYMCAPICLFYVNSKKDLIPLAIQLNQEPSQSNPVWTPRSHGEEWLLAKLWVRCVDFHHHLMISHILKCNRVIEPFCLGTMRQLSSSHPIYKLLKPHFRYLLPTNALIRKHLCEKAGAMDKWTSLGADGYRALIKAYFKNFKMDELDLPQDLMNRGVENSDQLPGYLYRDDGLKLWNAIGKFCFRVITHFYTTDDDVKEDTEIQAWITDIRKNGFPVDMRDKIGLPEKLSSICELADLMTKIIFTSTCQHKATSAEAMDLYGFLPLVPAMMRQPPPSKRGVVGRECIVKSLPEQSPEAYYGSLAYVMAMCQADDNPLGNVIETYFVEPEIQQIKQEFSAELKHISALINARNSALGPYTAYDNLVPEKIPNSIEPLPFCPFGDAEGSGLADVKSQFKSNAQAMGGMSAGAPAVPLMTLPICMSFAKYMGGRSFIGRRLTVNMFSKAMSNVSMDRVNVPMQAIDRKGHHLSRYRMNMWNQTAMM